MGVKVKMNVQTLETRIAQDADRALANGARSLRRIAERIEKMAKDFAPEDDGDLKDAIEVIPGEDELRRKTYIVRVNPDHPAHSDRDGNVNKTVGDYALLIERGLAPYGDGTYHLGPKSEAKAASGKDVGGRFMRRAFNKAVERALKDVGDAVKSSLSSGRAMLSSRNKMMSQRDYLGDDE